jgi:hypothetical protein
MLCVQPILVQGGKAERVVAIIGSTDLASAGVAESRLPSRSVSAPAALLPLPC